MNRANRQRPTRALAFYESSRRIFETLNDRVAVTGILLDELPVKQSAVRAERITAVKNNALYQLALTLRGSLQVGMAQRIQSR